MELDIEVAAHPAVLPLMERLHYAAELSLKDGIFGVGVSPVPIGIVERARRNKLTWTAFDAVPRELAYGIHFITIVLRRRRTSGAT